MLNPRDRRRVIVSAVIAVAVILAATLYFVVFSGSSSKPGRGIASDVTKSIRVDGIDLAAEVITPSHVAKPPLIVLPSSFGGSAKTVHDVSAFFARSGYLVVAYGQRGFGGSSGKVDFAGPGTQHDASAVITWALDNTKADPKRVAMMGFSYGAGISLLAAAHDPRIRAVAALSTWTDLAQTFTDVGTPHTAALRWLIGNPKNRGDYDATTRRLQSTLLDHPADLGAELRSISAVRSPDNYVKQLRKNNPAIMISNGFEDSIFNPAQLIPFFAKLKAPKRLELSPGDHGGPERSALTGTPNEVMDDVKAWFDHYLKGVNNKINQEDPIVVKDARTGELRPLTSWPTTTKKDRTELPKPGQTGTDVIPSVTWTASLHAGNDSGANSSEALFVPQEQYRLPTMDLTKLNKKAAFFWTSPAVQSGLPLAGTPSLRIDVAASAPTVTMYLYLYDVTADGTGTLVDMQPYTATGLSTKPKTLTIPMQPIAYSVPGGDRLTLVVDTADPNFQSLTPPNTTLTVTSSKTSTAAFYTPLSR
jgi:putative CocE/NonD family hydrolase